MPSDKFLNYDLHFRSTVPLLRYLLESPKTHDDKVNIFCQAKEHAGGIDVLDESHITSLEFTNLVKNGVDKLVLRKKVNNFELSLSLLN